MLSRNQQGQDDAQDTPDLDNYDANTNKVYKSLFDQETMFAVNLLGGLKSRLILNSDIPVSTKSMLRVLNKHN